MVANVEPVCETINKFEIYLSSGCSDINSSKVRGHIGVCTSVGGGEGCAGWVTA